MRKNPRPILQHCLWRGGGAVPNHTATCSCEQMDTRKNQPLQGNRTSLTIALLFSVKGRCRNGQLTPSSSWMSLRSHGPVRRRGSHARRSLRTQGGAGANTKPPGMDSLRGAFQGRAAAEPGRGDLLACRLPLRKDSTRPYVNALRTCLTYSNMNESFCSFSTHPFSKRKWSQETRDTGKERSLLGKQEGVEGRCCGAPLAGNTRKRGV